VESLTGGEAGEGLYCGAAGDARGITVVGSPDIVVADNEVLSLNGGDGCSGHDSIGGDAIGISVTLSDGAALRANRVRGLTSGSGQNGGQGEKTTGAAVGFEVSQSRAIVVEDFRAVALSALPPAELPNVQSGPARGLALTDSPSSRLSRVLVHHLSGEPAQGVAALRSDGLIIERATLATFTPEGQDQGAGIFIGEGGGADIDDSIVSDTAGRSIVSDAANAAGDVGVFHTLVDGGGGLAGQLVGVEYGDDVVLGDPRFDNIDRDHPYSLADDSPAVDAGDLAGCGDEPVCDGADACVPDLGYYATTDEAKARCL
jgi:hypothetical protein